MKVFFLGVSSFGGSAGAVVVVYDTLLSIERIDSVLLVVIFVSILCGSESEAIVESVD
jgi:hypothetical protein